MLNIECFRNDKLTASCYDQNVMMRNPGYLGICHPNYPNFYWLLGPGTGLGTNSIIFMIECQVLLSHGWLFLLLVLMETISMINDKDESTDARLEKVQIVYSYWGKTVLMVFPKTYPILIFDFRHENRSKEFPSATEQTKKFFMSADHRSRRYWRSFHSTAPPGMPSYQLKISKLFKKLMFAVKNIR